jgi:predicted nucleic acid-binding protein
VAADLRIFLDGSALFSAAQQGVGAARTILQLGEAGVISLWVGPWVLRETEAALERKAPESRAYFALMLDQAQVQVADKASIEAVQQTWEVVDYMPDAQVVAEALEIGAHYFVSADRAHLVDNPRMEDLPFPVGTPEDFLAWYRERLVFG